MSGWKSIASAPSDRDVQLWVQDRFGSRALPYPCRLTMQGWINSWMNIQLSPNVKPAYWREWDGAAARPCDPPE
jgi:hypothetical protein